MLGTIVNVAAIIIGGLLGILFRKLIKKELLEAVLKVVGMVVLIFGLIGVLQSMVHIEGELLKTEGELLLLVFLAVGTLIGEVVKIDEHLIHFGEKLEHKLNKGAFSEGFITASLIFCVGAMAIIGSISAAGGNYQVLYLKAAIDGITAMILASTLGFGVLFSGITVFLYQGSITLLSSALDSFMSDAFINSFNAVGYVIVGCIGLNFLREQKLKIANMIPSLFLVILYYLIRLIG